MDRARFVFARLAVAAGFLSAVADRFGLWGPAGAPRAAWGNFEAFTAYTARLLPFIGAAYISLFAWTATVAEIVLAVLLIAGVRPRETAVASAALLLSFALAMTWSLGIKAPLDYSVFAAAGAAWLTGADETVRAEAVVR
jgi:uncharacterized membrane protein YphA (DoxX/SURF4 family)